MNLPSSIREINALSDDKKRSIYTLLLPDWIYTTYDINPDLLTKNGKEVVKFRCPNGSRAVEIFAKRDIYDRDPVLYVNVADTFNNQLLVLLVVVNDPDSPRFDTDVDEHGKSTQFGTTGRNLVAEELAMKAGLAPGQIRRGLRSFSQSVPIFEDFVRKMDTIYF